MPQQKVAGDPLAMAILHHLKMARSDYLKSISKNLKEGEPGVQARVEALVSQGLVEKVPPGMLKRKHARLKKKLETHQHHTYYTLSREGDLFLRRKKS